MLSRLVEMLKDTDGFNSIHSFMQFRFCNNNILKSN